MDCYSPLLLQPLLFSLLFPILLFFHSVKDMSYSGEKGKESKKKDRKW